MNDLSAKIEIKTVKPVIRKPESKLFISVVSSIYFVAAVIGVFNHEMWRDEIQTWLVGSSSASFADFFQNMRNESNPLLWYLCNFLISSLTDDPFGAQLFHIIISSVTIFVVLSYAPFNKLQKVLFCFGYFVLFEYGIIARGYALTVLFFFIFCAFFSMQHPRKYLFLTLILLLLSNATGAHGIILSLSLAAMTAFDFYFAKKTSVRRSFSFRHLALAAGIFFFGIWLAMKFISPPEDSDRANMWFMEYDSDRFLSNLKSIGCSFFPIVDFSSSNFWNTNILLMDQQGLWGRIVVPLISLALFLYFAIVYSKELSVFVFYTMAIGGILLFSYMNSTIYTLFAARYYGFIFLSFVGAAWFLFSANEGRLSVPVLNNIRKRTGLDKYFPVVLTSLLAVNSVGGIVAYGKDIVLTFSNIRNTGEYLMKNKLNDNPLTGFTDYAVSPVSAFVKKPIYYPDRDTTNTFVIWTTKNYTTDGNRIINRMMNFINKNTDTTVVLLNFDLNTAMIGDVNFLHLASFKGAVVADENYSVYLASKFDLEADLKNTSVPLTDERIRNYIGIAMNLLQQNKIPDCEKIIARVKAKAEERKISRFHNCVGMLYLRRSQLDSAKAEFKKEIALDLNREEAYFQLGMVHYQSQKMDSALYCWEEALKINPSNVDAISNAAVVYFNVKKDNDKAQQLWEKALSLNPRYTQLYINLMMICQNKNDEACMLKHLKAALSYGMTVEEIRSKGINVSDPLLSKLR